MTALDETADLDWKAPRVEPTGGGLSQNRMGSWRMPILETVLRTSERTASLDPGPVQLAKAFATMAEPFSATMIVAG